MNKMKKKKECFIKAWSNELMKQCAIQEKSVIYKLEDAGIWGRNNYQARPVVINNYKD
jgi:hypothetical protein